MSTTAAAPAKYTTPTEQEIRIERVFNAPRDLVWRAYTDPEWIAQWWGRGNKLVVEKMEVERGGHWRYVEEANGEMHGFEGRYAEVTPKTKIIQTFEWDGMPGYPSRQTVEFEDYGDNQTKVVTVAIFFTRYERDGMMNAGMEGGLNQSYEALDKLLASKTR